MFLNNEDLFQRSLNLYYCRSLTFHRNLLSTKNSYLNFNELRFTEDIGIGSNNWVKNKTYM